MTRRQNSCLLPSLLIINICRTNNNNNITSFITLLLRWSPCGRSWTQFHRSMSHLSNDYIRKNVATGIFYSRTFSNCPLRLQLENLNISIIVCFMMSHRVESSDCLSTSSCYNRWLVRLHTSTTISIIHYSLSE